MSNELSKVMFFYICLSICLALAVWAFTGLVDHALFWGQLTLACGLLCIGMIAATETILARLGV